MLGSAQIRGVKFHWQFKRNGTTSLFAALDVATGSVIGTCYRRHRAREFLDFLKVIEAHVPDDLDIHIVMDNYSTHKTAAVKAWLARRPHWHVHFTPTSASWINQVERWFAELTRKQLQRGVHRSTRQLEADIRAFIEQHNEDPNPFKWTKSADDILAAVKRFRLCVDQNLCHELQFQMTRYQSSSDAVIIVAFLASVLPSVAMAISTRAAAVARRNISTPIKAASSHRGHGRSASSRPVPASRWMGAAGFLDNNFIERLWHSLKYEYVYLHAFSGGRQARLRIGNWVIIYNHRRPHAAPGRATPVSIYIERLSASSPGLRADLHPKTQVANARDMKPDQQARTVAYITRESV